MSDKKKIDKPTESDNGIPFVVTPIEESAAHENTHMEDSGHRPLFIGNDFDDDCPPTAAQNNGMMLLNELPETENPPRSKKQRDKSKASALPDTGADKKDEAPVKAHKSTFAFAAELTLKLLLICAATAALLAFVNHFTAPIIAENELAKKELALSSIFPELTAYETFDASQTDSDEIYIVSDNNGAIGYCAVTTPSGFGGKLNMMVGVDSERNVRGIRIIGHSETAGVGTNALNDAYLSLYNGLGGTGITLGDGVDAYAHATVTSKAVNAGVNRALSAYDVVFADMSHAASDPEAAINAAVNGMYGWVDNAAFSRTELETPFDAMYFVTADGLNAGYAAVVKVTAADGSATLLIGTWAWPEQLLGVRVLETEGEAFKALASDTEYISSFRGATSLSDTADDPAKAAINAAASKVFAYYGEYKKLANRTEFSDAELNSMMLEAVKAQYNWVTDSIFSLNDTPDDFDMIYNIKADGADAGICALVTIEADDGYAKLAVGTWAWPEKQILSVTPLHSDSESISAFFADDNNIGRFRGITEPINEAGEAEMSSAESAVTDAVNRVIAYYTQTAK